MILSVGKGCLVVIFLLLGVSLSCQANIEYSHDRDSKIGCLSGARQEDYARINLKRLCPNLYHALWENQLTEALEFPLPDQITQAQLSLLQAAVQYSEGSRKIDYSGLDELLEEIYIVKTDEQENATWKQFLAWLNSFKPEQYEAEFNWLVKFLEAVSPSVKTARIIMYLVFGVIILLAVGLLFRELYLSGIFIRSKQHTRQTQPKTNNKAELALSQLSYAEIKKLDPKKQAISLLKKIIEYLVNHNSLPKNEALTNLELKRYLQRENSLSAQPFALLLADVEPVLYGNSKPSELELERCWQHAEQIVRP